jgi:hypothetical protein
VARGDRRRTEANKCTQKGAASGRGHDSRRQQSRVRHRYLSACLAKLSVAKTGHREPRPDPGADAERSAVRGPPRVVTISATDAHYVTRRMWRRCPAMHFATVVYPSVTQPMHAPFIRDSTVTTWPVSGCDPARAVQRAVHAAGLVLAILIAGCRITGPNFCWDYCPSASPPIPVNVVVVPDSLVSTDPTNQIGILTVGDSVVLRVVRLIAGSINAACSSQEVVEDSLRWGVTDSSIATVNGSKAGMGVLYARHVGSVQLLTTSLYSSLTLPGAIACPSGRSILTIEIVAGPPSGPVAGANR